MLPLSAADRRASQRDIILLKQKVKVSLYERKLSVGGGMWGGGMMFNEVVVQEAGKQILDELGIRTQRFQENYYTADSVEAVSTLDLGERSKQVLPSSIASAWKM